MTKVVDGVVDGSGPVDNQEDTIAGRLKIARQRLEMTQKDLVQASGIPLPSLRDYELGKRIPGGDAVASLIRAGINANWLLTGNGSILWSDMLEEAKERRGKPHKDLDRFQLMIVKHALARVRSSWFVTAVSEPGHPLNEIVDDYNLGRIFIGNNEIRLAIPRITIEELVAWGRAQIAKMDRAEYAAESAVEESTAPGYVAIPLYNNIRAAAGHGAIVEHERPDDALMFKEDWIRYELGASPSDLCLIRVSGDSMEPTLRAGDIILIDHRASRPDREGIYIIRMGEMLLVKRLQALPGAKVKVISDNAAFDSWTIDLVDIGNEVAIIGRVVWSGRRL